MIGQFSRTGRYGWLPLLLWLLMVAPALALELRVAIGTAANEVTVGSSTPARILDAANRPLANLQPLEGVTARSIPGGVSLQQVKSSRLWIEPGEGGYVFIGDRWYRGKVKLAQTDKGLIAVNYVNLEDYLASVVGKEMYPTWPEEALKAQAVAARSFALYRRQVQQRQPGSLFDLGDTVISQVYNGVESEFPSTEAAATATRGQVLTHGGRIVEAVFHSASGGFTENSENVWSKPVPYLRSVPDFDQESPSRQWSASLTAAQLKQRLPGVGNIISLRPVRVSPQGRVMAMQVIGDKGSQTIPGNQLRRALGLRSTLFTATPQMGLVAATSNAPTLPESFLFNGRGHGHGLGMSQWGAYGMAKQGYGYQQILQHYYQGTTLTIIPMD